MDNTDNNKIMYIKVLETQKEVLKNFDDSYKNRKPSSYYFSIKDVAINNDIEAGKKYKLIVLLHDKKDISGAYLGICITSKTKNGIGIYCSIKAKLSICTSVKNICKFSELNLTDDFETGSYVLLEESELISEQIDFIIRDPKLTQAAPADYESLTDEVSLHPLAQRNEYCKRQYNLRKQNPANPKCSEYQRDCDRIVHSKAFRRMVDKAQVFSASKGDYYRTRMTHSQAVSQIARRIAAKLHLNLYLTEAIALGHDIGHTPFGHQGERTLDQILHGEKYDIIKNLDTLSNDNEGEIPMGFKHNYQSVRVASELEEKYAGIYGMDLSFQTLEGMLKHTRLKRDKFSLSQFTSCAENDLHFQTDFCSTLEGQVVEIADEIAQRGHDLDDAFFSGAITIEELKKYFSLKKIRELSNIVEETLNEIDTVKKGGWRLVDENELGSGRIVAAIVSYFINDTIKTSQSSMEEYSVDEFNESGHSIGKRIIALSNKAQKLNDYLGTIISNRVVNSPEVSLFDSNAATIVSGLFKAYYNNPRLLHSGTTRRLYIEIRKFTRNVIDFEFCNHTVIQEEIDLMTQSDLCEIKKNDTAKYEEYKQKRRLLVRHICDFISGMTDTYAINEYNKIFK